MDDDISVDRDNVRNEMKRDETQRKNRTNQILYLYYNKFNDKCLKSHIYKFHSMTIKIKSDL